MLIGHGTKACLPDLCRNFGFRTAIIADEAVKDFYTEGEVFTINGEGSKSREMKAHLEDQLLTRGFGRDTVIVAVGGGVTTDLAGFLAATYMRGVPLILVPTTLLAMVDAAIGGKTGVNTPYGKNTVGAFYEPQAIIIDLDALETLPQREIENGRAEILKMGLVWDRMIFGGSLEAQIRGAIQAKLEVVRQDPKERGLRRILNFGHTVAHAIEVCSQYRIAHGQAVAMGCVAESFLSMHLGYLCTEDFEKIVSLFPKYEWDFPDLLGAMRLDKKNEKGEIRSVLIDRIGHAMEFEGAYCTPIEDEDFLATFEWMEKNSVSC